jgi:NAD(P)-dependent dehydrogenase (short-subunit alcohol dehydrogenase family)
MSLPSLKKYHKDTYPTIDPSRPELSQAGKTVIVSGGSTGIGFAISRGFALAGASRVIVLGRRPDVTAHAVASIREEVGPAIDVRAWAVDVSSLEHIHKLWSELEAEGVYVDVLVLSASAYGKIATIMDMGAEAAWADFEVNVRSPLYMTERFYKQTTGQGQKVCISLHRLYLIFVFTLILIRNLQIHTNVHPEN